MPVKQFRFFTDAPGFMITLRIRLKTFLLHCGYFFMALNGQKAKFLP